MEKKKPKPTTQTSPNGFYTLVEYFAKENKGIFLHSYSRPFSKFLGHSCYMSCLLETEKEKQLCLGWR